MQPLASTAVDTDIAQSVQVVVSSASMRTKFNAGLVPGRSRALRHDADAIWGLANDEYQSGGWEGAAAQALGMSWVMFLGDGGQAREPTGLGEQFMLGGSLVSDRPISHESPLHRHTSVSWLDRSSVMQHGGLAPLSHWHTVLPQQILDDRMNQSRAQLPWVRFLDMEWIWRKLGINYTGVFGKDVALALYSRQLSFQYVGLCLELF